MSKQPEQENQQPSSAAANEAFGSESRRASMSNGNLPKYGQLLGKSTSSAAKDFFAKPKLANPSAAALVDDSLGKKVTALAAALDSMAQKQGTQEQALQEAKAELQATKLQLKEERAEIARVEQEAKEARQELVRKSQEEQRKHADDLSAERAAIARVEQEAKEARQELAKKTAEEQQKQVVELRAERAVALEEMARKTAEDQAKVLDETRALKQVQDDMKVENEAKHLGTEKAISALAEKTTGEILDVQLATNEKLDAESASLESKLATFAQAAVETKAQQDLQIREIEERATSAAQQLDSRLEEVRKETTKQITRATQDLEGSINQVIKDEAVQGFMRMKSEMGDLVADTHQLVRDLDEEGRDGLRAHLEQQELPKALKFAHSIGAHKGIGEIFNLIKKTNLPGAADSPEEFLASLEAAGGESTPILQDSGDGLELHGVPGPLDNASD